MVNEARAGAAAGMRQQHEFHQQMLLALFGQNLPRIDETPGQDRKGVQHPADAADGLAIIGAAHRAQLAKAQAAQSADLQPLQRLGECGCHLVIVEFAGKEV